VNRTLDRAFDGYLVSLSQAGSRDALDGLARRWSPRLLRYAARVLGPSGDGPETARDVVQETWIAVIQGLRGLRDPAQFAPWIYGIATRKCVDAIRVNVRRRRSDLRAASAPEGHVAGKLEDQIDLATAIRKLTPMHRAVVHLFYREELSVDDIASALGIPVGTVKSRLHHARGVLSRHLRHVASRSR